MSYLASCRRIFPSGDHIRLWAKEKGCFSRRAGQRNPVIQREKTMKHGSREWKIKATVEQNPDWEDLYATWPDTMDPQEERG
jgi:hypothetical protein